VHHMMQMWAALMHILLLPLLLLLMPLLFP
jgi:hypothetical protein